MSAPSARSASTRSPIGRSCIRGDARQLVVAAARARAPRSAGATPCPRCRGSRRAALDRKRAAGAVHDAVAASPRSRRRATPSAAQRVEHPIDVVGVEQSASSVVVPRRERREQQRAIGDALRARQRDRARARARPARGRARAETSLVIALGSRGRRPRPPARRSALPRAARRRGAREQRFERRAIARGEHRGDAVELRAIARRSRAAARRDWRARCRATFPASSPAMRVKSRKPLAA